MRGSTVLLIAFLVITIILIQIYNSESTLLIYIKIYNLESTLLIASLYTGHWTLIVDTAGNISVSHGSNCVGDKSISWPLITDQS